MKLKNIKFRLIQVPVFILLDKRGSMLQIKLKPPFYHQPVSAVILMRTLV